MSTNQRSKLSSSFILTSSWFSGRNWSNPAPIRLYREFARRRALTATVGRKPLPWTAGIVILPDGQDPAITMRLRLPRAAYRERHASPTGWGLHPPRDRRSRHCAAGLKEDHHVNVLCRSLPAVTAHPPLPSSSRR